MISEKDEIIIPQSGKAKFLLIVRSFLLTAIGVWFMIQPPQIKFTKMLGPILVFVLGLALFLFFGFILYKSLKKYRDISPGLTINSQGIRDEAGGIAVGFIPWNDIQSIRVEIVLNKRLIIVEVLNPEIYLQRQTSLIKKKLMKMNFKKYGSPVCISVATLGMDFDKVSEIIYSAYTEYKK